jgi:hypothetical protein
LVVPCRVRRPSHRGDDQRGLADSPFHSPQQLRLAIIAVAVGQIVVNTLTLIATPIDLEIVALLAASFWLALFAANRRIAARSSTRPRRVLAVGASR